MQLPVGMASPGLTTGGEREGGGEDEWEGNGREKGEGRGKRRIRDEMQDKTM